MSDVSRSNGADAGRALRPAEAALLSKLLPAVGPALLAGATVAEMKDGGMGSLRFAPFAGARSYGATLSSARFADADGVAVSVAVHADEQGRLLELDLWKADFSPLIRYPDPAEVTVEPRQVEGSGSVRLSHPA